MEKEFDKWNIKKKQINLGDKELFYKEREIWWCSLGVNVGFEQDGTGINFDRPILIIKGFNKNTFLGIALTGKIKKGKYYHYLGKVSGRDATAVLSQLRMIDSRRLVRKIETLEDEIFGVLKTKLKSVIFGP